MGNLILLAVTHGQRFGKSLPLLMTVMDKAATLPMSWTVMDKGLVILNLCPGRSWTKVVEAAFVSLPLS